MARLPAGSSLEPRQHRRLAAGTLRQAPTLWALPGCHRPSPATLQRKKPTACLLASGLQPSARKRAIHCHGTSRQTLGAGVQNPHIFSPASASASSTATVIARPLSAPSPAISSCSAASSARGADPSSRADRCAAHSSAMAHHDFSRSFQTQPDGWAPAAPPALCAARTPPPVQPVRLSQLCRVQHGFRIRKEDDRFAVAAPPARRRAPNPPPGCTVCSTQLCRGTAGSENPVSAKKIQMTPAAPALLAALTPPRTQGLVFRV